MMAKPKIMNTPRTQNAELKDFTFASESVAEGHPDKVCDRVSDAIVDLFLAADPQGRVACETLATTDTLILAGECAGPARVTKDKIIETARNAVEENGYEQE